MRCRRALAYVVDHVVVEGRSPPACRQCGCGAVDSGVASAVSGGDELFPQGVRNYKHLLVGEYVRRVVES